MDDLPRLREYADGDVGDLIRAGRADGPRDAAGSRRRLAATLAALESPSVAHARVRPAAPRWSRWSIAGVGVALVGGLMLHAASSGGPSSSGGAPVAPAAEVAAEVAAATPPAAATPAPFVPSIPVSDLPTATVAPTAVAARPTPRDAKPSEQAAAPPLDAFDELAAIERVRKQLSDGHPEAAQREIALYRATVARGRFTEEIEALEIEALSAGGARADAEEKAAQFLARYPLSPYARRVRSVVRAIDTTETP